MTAVLAAVGVATLVSGFIVIGTSGTAQADDSPVAPNDHQIAICHATGGGKFSIPYPAKKQISDDKGHRSGGGVHPDDIIPPFSAGGEGGSAWGAFGGQNWDSAGQAIYASGCGMPADKRVSPVYPTVEPPNCERDGYLEVPGEQPIGVVVVAQGTDGAGPGTYTFRYAAADGYILVDDDEVTVTVLPRLTGDQCGRVVVPEARPYDPCGSVSDFVTVTVDGDIYRQGNADYPFTVEGSRAQGFTITFAEKEGVTYRGGRTLKVGSGSWTDMPCPLPVKPVAPTVVQSPACEVEGTYTIPNTPGVKYLLDGVEIAAGTYDGPESGTVTAAALSGYQLTAPLDYALDLPAAVECEEPPPPVKDVCTNLNGVQPDVPKGYTEKDGICTEIEVLPTESTDVCSNLKGAQAAVPAGLEAQDGKCVRPAEEKPDEVVGPDEVLGTAEAVPTAVDAGLGGSTVTTASTSSPLGQGLVGAGLVMLLLAGAMQMGRARGAHQA